MGVAQPERLICRVGVWRVLPVIKEFFDKAAGVRVVGRVKTRNRRRGEGQRCAAKTCQRVNVNASPRLSRKKRHDHPQGAAAKSDERFPITRPRPENQNY